MAAQSLLSSIWAYNSRSGSVIQETQAEFDVAASLGIGWHGPFTSKAAALAYYDANKAANPGWKAPAGVAAAVGNAITNNPITAPVTGAASATLGAVDAIPKFLSRLTSGALWLRIEEVAAGLILLGIGVNALFHGRPMGTVTNVAGKLAPLALA